MAKSFDKQLITNNDDIIRSVLKTELASITACKSLHSIQFLSAKQSLKNKSPLNQRLNSFSLE